MGTGPVIRGRGVGHGSATGIARVVHDPEAIDSVREGEVLVAPILAGAHVSVLERCAAVVTDVGSHLPEGAPEGVVAVLGTGIATRNLRDGVELVVDADSGIVHLPEDAEPIWAGFKPKVPYKFAIAGGVAALALLVKALR